MLALGPNPKYQLPTLNTPNQIRKGNLIEFTSLGLGSISNMDPNQVLDTTGYPIPLLLLDDISQRRMLGLVGSIHKPTNTAYPVIMHEFWIFVLLHEKPTWIVLQAGSPDVSSLVQAIQ